MTRASPGSDIPQISEEALNELVTDTPQGESYPAVIPDGGRATEYLFLLGETPL